MRSIKGRNTGPELVVRRIAHAMGYRFRLHRKDLPGTPDLAFAGRRKAIFVNGCLWHGHGCRLTRVPRSNRAFWVAKLTRNRARDERNAVALSALGWQHLVIWECETQDGELVVQMLRDFLG